MFDESTRIAVKKHGIIIVRLWHPGLRRIISVMWALVPIYNIDDDDYDASSESVFNRIMESFDWFRTTPRENLEEFVADGAAHMMGARNSVATRFARDFANITCTICCNHSATLCARHAALADDAIPADVIHLSRDIHTSLNSPNRRNILHQQQVSTKMSYEHFFPT
ncbi:hypothetical protein QAD02_013470 [Eretmocerus hayati]|uniref:Uncharacterized protein n=1 Tax=Eretmocerus hayati TaxID=131215 RepID=A0ACC2P3J9_9HYME|nr:hypothetical protein QAD02_013470 [Eretmocerus hayati]